MRAFRPGPSSACARLPRQTSAAAQGWAQALARDAGRIEVGALADLVALDTDNAVLHGAIGDAVLDIWIFAGDTTVVSDVWSAGRHVVRNGRHPGHDAIVRRYRATLDRLLAAG